MGLIEEQGNARLESNMIEQSKTHRDPAQDQYYDPLAPYNCQMNHERRFGETMELKEMGEAQNIGKTSVSAQEKPLEIRETGLIDGEISRNEDTKEQEQTLGNVNKYLDSTYSEVASQNGLTCLKHEVIQPDTTYINPGCGKQVPMQVENTNDSILLKNDDKGSLGVDSGKLPAKVEVTNDSSLLEINDRGSSRQRRKRETKGPASSSWVLRPKSQEKPEAPEPIETVKESGTNVDKKRRGRKPKNLEKNTVNEFLRTRNHLRYLFHRINYEQNLIDAYSAEGWRGQSLDKLKPEKELEKAKSRILNYKMKIRALFQSLDQSLATGKLPESLFDAQGEIDSEDIFCAKCGSKDLTLDNDIILCDGACERGFHQFCLEPPLLKKDIPPGDESWLCPGCDCKADCIDMLKDYQGAKISILDSWEKIFPEAAAVSGKKMDDSPGLSSDDSEDEEYDPDKPDDSEKVEEDKSSSDESSYFSASDDLPASHNNEKYLGLPSDDSEDDDFDPSAPDQGIQEKQDSSSSDFTSDSEDLGGLVEDETVPCEDPWQTTSSTHHEEKSLGFNEEISNAGRKKGKSLKDELACLVEASAEPLSSKRHVERLDYKKLNDETYGNSSSDSSDEDFNDTITRKRRKTDCKTTEVEFSYDTLVTPGNTHNEDANHSEKNHSSKRTRRSLTDGHTTELSGKVGSTSSSANKSTHKRLGEAATQRLLASFNENRYPDKAAKESLAKELGLTFRQVDKWFTNTRWSFNHRPRLDSNSAEPRPTSGADGIRSSQNSELLESSAISSPNHSAKLREEDLVTDTSGDSS